MRRLFIFPGLVGRKGVWWVASAGLAALIYFSFSLSLFQAAQVHLRDGMEVHLLLRQLVTTENVEKDDVIQFEVAEDVVVLGHTVIAKGAPATGKVVRIKGAGKKKAKDASVTFQLVSVRAVDNNLIPLRKNPYKKEKSDSKENEIEEAQPIPDQVDRVIGAEKGKPYVAFLDQAAVVSVPDTPTPPPPVQPTAQAQPTAPQPNPSPAPAPPALGQEPAMVDFVTDPSGADIMIDGTFSGNTPSSLQLTPGRHTIELKLSGYRTYTRTLPVDAGSHPRISTTLEKE